MDRYQFVQCNKCGLDVELDGPTEIIPRPAAAKLPSATQDDEEIKEDSNAELEFYNEIDQTSNSNEHQPFERSGPFSYQEEQT